MGSSSTENLNPIYIGRVARLDWSINDADHQKELFEAESIRFGPKDSESGLGIFQITYQRRTEDSTYTGYSKELLFGSEIYRENSLKRKCTTCNIYFKCHDSSHSDIRIQLKVGSDQIFWNYYYVKYARMIHSITKYHNAEQAYIYIGIPPINVEVTYDRQEMKSNKFDSNFNISNDSNIIYGMLNDAQLTDFIIRVDEKEIKVHRCILAHHSTYFAKVFSTDSKERRKGSIDIVDFDYDSVYSMIDYMYGGKAKWIEYVEDVALLAHKYDIPKLKECSPIVLCHKVTLENFFTILDIAELYDSDSLLKSCAKFFKANGRSIVKSDKWYETKSNKIDLVVRLTELMFVL